MFVTVLAVHGVVSVPDVELQGDLGDRYTSIRGAFPGTGSLSGLSDDG